MDHCTATPPRSNQHSQLPALVQHTYSADAHTVHQKSLPLNFILWLIFVPVCRTAPISRAVRVIRPSWVEGWIYQRIYLLESATQLTNVIPSHPPTTHTNTLNSFFL